MRIITGRVVGGRIDLPSDALEEGTSVAVLAGDSEEPVALSAAEELQLSQAVEAIAVESLSMAATFSRSSGRKVVTNE